MEARSTLLAEAGSTFRLTAASGFPAEWAEEATLTHMLHHTGGGMHYVNGVPLTQPFPPVLHLISGTPEKPAPHGYASLQMVKQPGTAFHYSGGGFLVMQHLWSSARASPSPTLWRLGWRGTAPTFRSISPSPRFPGKHYANGYRDDGTGGVGAVELPAARGWCPRHSCRSPNGSSSLHSRTNSRMAASHQPRRGGGVTLPRLNLGSEAFMRARMGVGMFVFEAASSNPSAGPNKWMLHQAANVLPWAAPRVL